MVIKVCICLLEKQFRVFDAIQCLRFPPKKQSDSRMRRVAKECVQIFVSSVGENKNRRIERGSEDPMLFHLRIMCTLSLLQEKLLEKEITQKKKGIFLFASKQNTKEIEFISAADPAAGSKWDKRKEVLSAVFFKV